MSETTAVLPVDDVKKASSEPYRYADGERAERLDKVLWLVLEDKWEAGVTAPALAAEWSVSLSTVEKLGVEARSIARVVKRFAEGARQTADELADVRGTLETLMARLAVVEGSVKGADPKSFETKLREMARR